MKVNKFVSTKQRTHMQGLLEKTRLILRSACVATAISSCMLCVGLSHADDTEIFFSNEIGNGSNILFVLDTSGSMGGTDGGTLSRMARMKSAMTQILNNISKVNIGLMKFNGVYGGGTVLFPVTPIDKTFDPVTDSSSFPTARAEIVDKVNGLGALNGTPLVDSFYEAALYLRGEVPDFGRVRGVNSDPGVRAGFRLAHPGSYSGGSIYREPGCPVDYPNELACATEFIDGNPVYTSPITNVCQANHIVLVSDGETDRNDVTDRIKQLVGIDVNSSCDVSGDEACATELASWLNTSDHNTALPSGQTIQTHTIAFNLEGAGKQFLKEIAMAGGGSAYDADTTDEFVTAVNSIVNRISLSDSNLTAPTAAVSNFNRLTHRNDIYFGMFKPGLGASWDGNIKRYTLGTFADGTTKGVVDAAGQAVFDAATGAISDSARSFWSTSADGSKVTQGGAAAKLSLNRSIKTWLGTGTGSNSLIDFTESNSALDTTAMGLTTADATRREQIIQWARGVDLNDHDNDGNTTEVRAQMGDAMHSTPHILSYATTGNPESLVFIGTNEGFLHAINTNDGTESFAVIPPDLLPNLSTYYDNNSYTERTYGLDGSISSWTSDENGNLLIDANEKAYLYVGMRRGGRNYYAFDVSNRNQPKVAWVIRGGTGDFAELGETWSRPVKTAVRLNGVHQDVLIFSGGYDEKNDTRAERDTSDTMGRALYIVNATTGAMLATLSSANFADMKYSIPATPRVIDINRDGYADYLFVGDMGGQVWRFDIDNSTSGSLVAAIDGGVIANLADSGPANNRKFFNEADVALINSGDEEFLSISIGSGWRSHPLDQDVSDRFYSLKERNVFGPLLDSSGNPAYSEVKEADLFDATTVSTVTDTTQKSYNGWYIELDAGEKILNPATTLNDQVLFTSYLPQTSNSNDNCNVPVGQNRVYAIDVVTGGPAIDSAKDHTDRFRALSSAGIASSVRTYLTTVDSTGNSSPTTAVGLETISDIDLGKLFKRTFWAEQ